MKEYPETSPTLIARIKNPENVAAWDEFEKLYRPVIFRAARAKGMQYADAVDLVQKVLVSVSNAIGSYEQAQAGVPFRNWLNKVTRHAILKALTRQPKDLALGGTQTLDLLSAIPCEDDATTALIEDEIRREVFQRAAEKVRSMVEPMTWLAFEMSVLQQQPISSVAERLGVSISKVYAARSRVIRRLKEAVKKYEFNAEP